MSRVAGRNMAYLVVACSAGLVLWQSAAFAADQAPALSSDEVATRIFERQQLMQTLDDEGEVLGEIVAGLQPPDKLALTTRAIAQAAREAADAFRTPLPGGRSKPEVWTNHADFMLRMDAFARETEAMAILGEGGNLSAVTEKLGTAMPCKQCHDLYRTPKKPGQ